MERLVLKCSACKSNHNEPPIYKDFFYDVAYDEMCEWSEIQDEVPELNERVWNRLREVPIIGQTYFVKAQSPFNFAIGDDFKTVYRPALSALNGWDSYPEEISDSGIITCTFEEVISYNDYVAWIKVRVNDFYYIHDILNFKKKKMESVLNKYLIYGGYIFGKTNEYIYLSSSGQGDIGSWVLIKRNNDGYHILLLGDWSCYHDYTYVDNLMIEEDEINEFCNNAQVINMSS